MVDPYIYEFDKFRLDPTEHLLLYEGTPVSVTGKAFQVLVVLVRKSGHLIEKSELVAAVWGDTFVEEGNLAVTISMLRKILGDDRTEKKFIETVAKQGYRFLPAVNKVSVVGVEPGNDSDHSAAAVPESAIAANPLPATFSLKRYAAPAAFVLVLSVLGLVIQVKSHVHASRNPTPTVHSIAVIPFETTGLDQNARHIGTGVADDLIDKFGEIDRIEVRPASAVEKYVGSVTSPSSIGNEQRVDAVLTGTISSVRGETHVAAKLFAANGEVIWDGNYDQPLTRISDIEDQIEMQVVQTIFPGRGLLARPKQAIHDPQAYQLYAEGRYFWNKRTENGFRRSIECFQQALLKDPAYANAYAGLADSYTLLASYGVEPAQQAYPNAKASAMKALQLDDSLAEAHTSLGMVSLYYEWDWHQADREFRRAIDLNPNYPLAHTWDALYFAAMGDMPRALQQALRAQELDPLSLMTNTELGRVYYWDHQYDRAVANYRHAIELDPYFARAHTRLGMALAAQKDYSGAIREFQQASALSSPDPYIDGLTGYAQALGGNRREARRLLVELTNRAHHEYVPAFSVALLCVGLGDRDSAMEWLEKAYQDRSTYMVYANVDPLLDSIRSEPRFVALMQRMDLQTMQAENETIRPGFVPKPSDGFLR